MKLPRCYQQQFSLRGILQGTTQAVIPRHERRLPRNHHNRTRQATAATKHESFNRVRNRQFLERNTSLSGLNSNQRPYWMVLD